MYEIEKDVEIPAQHFRRPRTSKYPLREMEPGDSFFVPVGMNEDAVKVQRSISSMAGRWKIKITCRCIDGGVRVWRR